LPQDHPEDVKKALKLDNKSIYEHLDIYTRRRKFCPECRKRIFDSYIAIQKNENKINEKDKCNSCENSECFGCEEII